MTLRLWLQYIFNRSQYIKDLERFNVVEGFVDGRKEKITSITDYHDKQAFFVGLGVIVALFLFILCKLR